MSIIDDLKELLIESAFRKRDAFSLVHDLLDTIEKHFILQYVLRDNLSIRKWRLELADKIFIIGRKTRIKRGKQLKEKEYFNLLYKEPFEPDPEKEVKAMIYSLERSRKKYVFPSLDDVEIKVIGEKYKEFSQKISALLTLGDITHEDVYGVLDQIR